MSSYYNSADLAKFSEIGEGAPELWEKFMSYCWCKQILVGWVGCLYDCDSSKNNIAVEIFYTGEDL